MEKITNIFYNGIKYVNYGKANCARELMRYKAVEQQLVEKLLKRRDVADRLGIKVNSFRGKESEKWTHLEIPFDDDTLEQIYDFIMGSQLIGEKGEKRKEDAIQAVGYDVYIYEMETVERNREVIDHDIVLMLVYYLIFTDTARTYLWEKYKNEKEELLYLYKKSMFSGQYFWKIIPVEYLEQAYCMVGLIVKSREYHDQKIYGDVISALKQNNRRVVNYIKRIDCLMGEDLNQVITQEVMEKDTMVMLVARIISVLLIAESFGKEILVDYDLGKKLLHIFRYWDEYEQPAPEWEGKNILSEKTKLFLEQFEKEFTSYTRIDSVFFGKKHNETVTDMPEQIFKIFGINARKMYFVPLSEQEVNALAGLATTWNQKKYVLAMQIAVLCKYINKLEQYIIDRIVNNTSVQTFEYQEKEAELLKEKSEFEKSKKEFESRTEKLKKTNQMINTAYEKIKKDLEEQEILHIKEREELISLRNFVYQTSKTTEGDEEKQNFAQIIEDWREQPVVVIGGHSNWQKKIRNIFPKWKYVSAGQSTFPEQILTDRKYIICCTEVLAHSVYYKVIANKQENQALIYTRGINVEKFLMEIKAQKEGENAKQ